MKETIGHELSHGLGYSFTNKQLRRNSKKFSNWLTEIYADFVGVCIGCEGSLSDGIACFNHKIALSGRKRAVRKDDSVHPSFNNRLRYIESGKFDGDLIQKVADELNVPDGVVADAIQYFNDKYISLN